MALRSRKYLFDTGIKWIQARNGVLSSNNKTPIEVSCPPEFGGKPGYWTAEHLFVASIEACIMTTFKWLLEKAGGELLSYESKAIGTAQMVDGDFKLSRIDIKPVITSPKHSAQRIREAIEDARKHCLISKTLNLEVDVNPVIRIV